MPTESLLMMHQWRSGIKDSVGQFLQSQDASQDTKEDSFPHNGENRVPISCWMKRDRGTGRGRGEREREGEGQGQGGGEGEGERVFEIFHAQAVLNPGPTATLALSLITQP